MHDNLYRILGLNSDATHHQIKTAYRKLALVYHPDRKGWGQDTLADETQFKKLSEAYQVLSDPAKKDVYDFDLFSKHIISPILIQVYLSILNFLATSHHRPSKRENSQASRPHSEEQTRKSSAAREQKVRREIPEVFYANVKKMRSITVEIEVTIDDLYLHKIKRLQVWVKRRDNSQMISKVKTTVYVSLMNYQSIYLFPDLGDDGSYPHIKRGDIIVNLKIKPHNLITIDTVINKYDLWMTIPISLYEYYFGTRVKMPYLGGEHLDETICWDAKSDALLYEMPGYGLPHGDETGNFFRGSLYISCRVDLPSRNDPDLDLPGIEQVLKNYFSSGSVFDETHA